MISITLALVILLATFIFMYFTEMTARKRYQKWLHETEKNHCQCLNDQIALIDDYRKNFHDIKKMILADMKEKKDLYNNFSEWIEGLDTQTLTDELKEEIIRNANFNMD